MLTIVDEAGVLLGSSNWDPRSLRLNFEFDLECYDQTLAASLQLWLRDERLRQAQPVTLADLGGRSLPVKLRDGAARLLSPYLRRAPFWKYQRDNVREEWTTLLSADISGTGLDPVGP